MPRIFKGSESTLRLLISKSCNSKALTDIKIILYTTDVDVAIEIVDNITIEGNIATVSLGGRAFLHMDEGLINYIIEGMVDGDVFHTERQSDYMLKDVSFSDGVIIPQVMNIRRNGLYQITPEDEAYVDIYTEVPTYEVQKEATIDGLKAGDKGTYVPAEGYDVIGKVKYEVLPNLDITESFTENGTYEFDAPAGFSGFGHATLDVNVPTPKIQDTGFIKLRAGESGVLKPEEGYDGIAEVEYIAVPNEDLNAYIDKNGVHEFDAHTDNSGFGHVKIEVEVPTPKILPNASVELKAGDNGTYYPVGYDGVASIDYNVLPNYDIEFDFNDNGTYEFDPPAGFSGFGHATLNVDVPVPKIQDPINFEFSPGDKGTIYPDPGYDGIAAVNFTVTENAGPIKLPNGITLSGSTWEAFDGSQWDWSNVYDYSQMFKDCSKLKQVTNMPVKAKSFVEMFSGCSNLENIDFNGWDTNGVYSLEKMFYQCRKIKSIDLSNCDLSNICSMRYAFFQCYGLTELRFGSDISKLVNVDSMFQGVSSTGTLYYPEKYDYSKIINVLPPHWTAVPY